MWIINFIKEVINKMFATDVNKALGIKTIMTKDMLNAIDKWNKMYKGEAEWVNNDSVFSLGLEDGIVKEFANVTLNEMNAKVTNEKLNEIFEFAIRNLNEELQNGLALGAFIIKPLGENKVEYIGADKFLPVEFDAQGRLIKVIFTSTKKVSDNQFYHRLEFHSLDKSGLSITNKAFYSTSNTELGREVPLERVDEWSSLKEYINYPLMQKIDFGYYKNPIKNKIDDSPNGVSIFHSAIDKIRKTDTQFGRLDWEFESGERAINVDVMALEPTHIIGVNGKQELKVPKLNKRLYRGLNLGEKLYEEFSPGFRDQNLINGLEEYKREIEFSVGLSYGDLSNPQYVEKSATEVKVSKQRKYNTITSIQRNLKDCLEDLVYALAFYNGLTTAGYEFVCDFKDSILTDEETEREQDRRDVSMGVMSNLEYRMKWYGEEEKTARKMLPEQAELIE